MFNNKTIFLLNLAEYPTASSAKYQAIIFVNYSPPSNLHAKTVLVNRNKLVKNHPFRLYCVYCLTV